MNLTETKFEYQVCSKQEEGVGVIIVAAGSSSRMQGQNKLLLKLNGIPVIIKTLLAFENCSIVDSIVLVTRQEDIFSMQSLVNGYGISKLTDIVGGGKSRQESVLKGFQRIGDIKKVLIHDAARPLVSGSVIFRVASALNEHSAAIAAVNVKDTIKTVSQDGMIEKTLNRDSLISVQTPQGVNAKDYLWAVKQVEDVSVFTDDASIMEKAGFKVKAVEGDYKNIKITTPEDINIAEALDKEERY